MHKVAAHPARPEQMYAQNHHGVYRSDDGGRQWTSIADGLPADFGFPIVVHPPDPDTVFVFPLVADGQRIPPDGRARVWRSTDAGETWTPSTAGLPDRFFAAVMRDAFAADDAEQTGLYFGARDGTVFASLDDGESWAEIVDHLPDVLSVRAAVVYRPGQVRPYRLGAAAFVRTVPAGSDPQAIAITSPARGCSS